MRVSRNLEVLAGFQDIVGPQKNYRGLCKGKISDVLPGFSTISKFLAGLSGSLEGFQRSQQDLSSRILVGPQMSQDHRGGFSGILEVFAGSQKDLQRYLHVFSGLSRISEVVGSQPSQQDYRGICMSQYDIRCLTRSLEPLAGFGRLRPKSY